MIHSLFRGQSGNGGQDAESICRQEDNLLRMSGHSLHISVGNRCNRIGGASVLGKGIVVQFQTAGLGIHDDVFQHRTEAPSLVENLWLALWTQADDLRVAAAFVVEDAVVAPAMLIVADQRPSGVSA